MKINKNATYIKRIEMGRDGMLIRFDAADVMAVGGRDGFKKVVERFLENKIITYRIKVTS